MVTLATLALGRPTRVSTHRLPSPWCRLLLASAVRLAPTARPTTRRAFVAHTDATALAAPIIVPSVDVAPSPTATLWKPVCASSLLAGPGTSLQAAVLAPSSCLVPSRAPRARLAPSASKKLGTAPCANLAPSARLVHQLARPAQLARGVALHTTPVRRAPRDGQAPAPALGILTTASFARLERTAEHRAGRHARIALLATSPRPTQ